MADPVHTVEPTSAPRPAESVGVSPPRERTTPDRWAELRGLIVGPERERINKVEKKLEDPRLNLDEVSELLPEAIQRRAKDRELGKALGPVVGEAIKASVRKDPQPIVDAIFPIIGPAIRRAIAAAFAELVQSVNTTLEHSFTPRGLGWRFEALRTGKSFGEVVLSHSLVFRAEQLFLIHRESGLLVKHVTATGVKALSPDMVAGMLTAITEFARDSFQVSRQEGLDSLALGDLTVWVEQGPAVTIAAVVRGQAPAAYREVLQEAVEGVQRAHATDLDTFAADGKPFEIRPELLEPCLISQLAEPGKAATPWKLIAIAGLVLLGIGWCAYPRVRSDRAFNRYVGELREEPGVVVGNVGRRAGKYVVTGLRDPLARDPRALLAATRIDTSLVTSHWEPYIALRPEFVLRRVGGAIKPPSTVNIIMRGDTLAAVGSASRAWIDRARGTAAAVAGVGVVDFSAVADSVDLAMRAKADVVEQMFIAFPRGDTYPEGRFRSATDSMAALIAELLGDGAANDRDVTVEARASTDSIGAPGVNSSLRQGRAVALRSLLISRGVPSRSISVNQDSTSGVRRAYLRVTIRPLSKGSL